MNTTPATTKQLIETHSFDYIPARTDTAPSPAKTQFWFMIDAT